MTFYALSLLLFVVCLAVAYVYQRPRDGESALFEELDEQVCEDKLTTVDCRSYDVASDTSAEAPDQNGRFFDFRVRFLTVYSLAVAADWLQGSFMYSVYRYTHNLADDRVACLFSAGFLSAGVSALFLGALADRFGRKKMCLAYCVFYSVSCLTVLTSQVPVLFLGRIFGGLSTTILFTSFEAWMLGEMSRLDLDKSGGAVGFLYGTMSACNGCVAVVSGLVAELLVQSTGSHKAPFLASIICLIAASAIIQVGWVENYGKPQLHDEKARLSSNKIPTELGNMACLSLAMCSVEGAMYIMIFSWPQALLSARNAASEQGSEPPFGLIFSNFMCAVTLGSIFFNLFTRSGNIVQSSLAALQLSMAAASFSLIVTVVTRSEISRFVAFCLFELCLGAYFPSIGCLKSKAVGDQARASFYGLMRAPLNLYVQLALVTLKQGDDSRDFRLIVASALILPCCAVLTRYAR